LSERAVEEAGSESPTPEVTVVLPAHNEVMLIGSTITNVVTALEARGRRFELVVVENGSTDGTRRLVSIIAAQLPSVQLISLDRPNYGSALAAGIRAAGGSLLATFDVDYYDLEFFDRASESIKEDGADIVLASKRAPGSEDRRPLIRRIMTAAFSSLLSSVLGLEVSDAHGMKLMRTASIAPLVEETVSRGSLFDVELVTRAARRELKIVELPVAVRELRPPRSSVVRRTIETAVGLVRLRLIVGGAPREARRSPSRFRGAGAERALELIRSARSRSQERLSTWWTERRKANRRFGARR
jgi:hypothetical protein